VITTFIGKYSIANRKIKKKEAEADKLNGDENATDASDESPTKK
jgi:hypothetical protein